MKENKNKNKHLRNIANKIAKLEKEIRLGNNVQVNRKKIEDIMCSLDFGDIIFIDNYISKKKLID